MPFKQIRVSPVLDVDAYSDDDILFALAEIPLPVNDAVLVRNITIVDRAKVDAGALDMQLLFMNTDDNVIGTVQGAAVSLTAFNARNGVIGLTHYSNATQTADADFDNFNVSSSTDNNLTTAFNKPIVLQPLSGSSSVYFTAISVGETPTFAGVTGVTVNKAADYGADSSTTIEVDGVSALLHYKIGDTVIDADDVVIGIVKSLTATEITLTTNNIGALTDDDTLFTPHSLEFIFDVEYSIQ